MIVIAIHSSLTAVGFFNNGYVGKQPMAWKDYSVEYCLKELQENMDGCTGSCDIAEILSKTMWNTIQPYNVGNEENERIDIVGKGEKAQYLISLSEPCATQSQVLMTLKK